MTSPETTRILSHLLIPDATVLSREDVQCALQQTYISDLKKPPNIQTSEI